MADDRSKRKRTLSLPQLWGEVKSLKNKLDTVAGSVAKLKEMLNATDNWHKRIIPMIGKNIVFVSESSARDSEGDGGTDRVIGKLLYSDRYTLGICVEDEDRLYNKGKIEYVALVD